MQRQLRLCFTILLAGLACISVNADAKNSNTINTQNSATAVAALNARPIDARDLKTLHYLENAHGQLEEWSKRLLSRLENGMGPRTKDPVLDGRADLQVQKIQITYASYTKNHALSQSLQHLAQAHRDRLTALQAMVDSGADRNQFDALSTPVNELITDLRTWSKKR